MLEQLFGSNTRVDILRLFFRSPAEAFYVREITRALDTQINAVRRELQILLEAHIVIETPEPSTVNSESPGAKLRKYYRVNTESNLYHELDALIIKEQVLEEQDLVNDIIEKGGDISFLLIAGRFASGKPAPADLLIVGDIKQKRIERLISEYEKKHAVEVMYSIMPESEFFERRHMMDKFIYSMFEADHIKVIDKVSQR
jgi:DNA-binding transcriptional ArsR family regulator